MKGGEGKKGEGVSPPVITVSPPGSRGARIVTDHAPIRYLKKKRCIKEIAPKS